MFLLHLFNYVKCVAVPPCLPEVPDWSNKELNSQHLGCRGIGGAKRVKREQKKRMRETEEMPGTRQPGSCQPARHRKSRKSRTYIMKEKRGREGSREKHSSIKSIKKKE